MTCSFKLLKKCHAKPGMMMFPLAINTLSLYEFVGFHFSCQSCVRLIYIYIYIYIATISFILFVECPMI